MKKIKRKPKKLKISACYIVKNSAEDLKISLQSLCDSVDEIIVVDTGSTDKTVEVAKSFGAKVFFREWDDDFSAPRNLAISQATGDWIIFLDSDEFFTNETKKNIRPAVEQLENSQKQGLLIHLVNIDVIEKKIIDTNFVMRIFKNYSGLHYVGKIHEEPRIGENILSEITFAPPNILTIFHTGYSANLSKSKAERNLKILLEELTETEEPQRIYGYIAECYSGLDDFENAEKFARLDIESGKTQKLFSTGSYRILMNILAKDFSRSAEREKIAALAVKNFPALPEFTAELAECFAQKKDFQKAVETMKSAIQKFKNYKELEPTQFNEDMAKFAESRIKLWTEKFLR